MTADCLPIVLHDSKNNVVAVVHAGWRGTAGNILSNVLLQMKESFSSQPKDINCFFGPSARACCYEVKDDLVRSITAVFSFVKEHDKIFVRKENKIFFDNSALNKALLLSMGIPEQNINQERNLCTICNTSHHSHRRDGVKAGRQVTVVVLNSL